MNKKDCILAIDIGNTRAKLATIKNSEVITFRAISSKPEINKEELLKVIDELSYESFSLVLISSVVPHNNEIIKKALKNKLLCPIHILTRGLEFIVKEKYGEGKAGMDIICKSAYLVHNKQEALCLDSGTATVINYVSKEGFLENVGITVGYRGIYRALNNDASLLPLFEPNKANRLLNNNTHSAIDGGSYFGYLGLLNNLVKKAQEETGCKTVYFTGGYSFLFKDKVEFPHIYDPYILLKGMYLIYIKNKEFFKN